MAHEQITISTAEGSCPVHVLTSDDGSGGPAIIFYMDAGGIRPAAIGMAERLADAGYVVLLPDLFYRHGPYGPFDPKELFKGVIFARCLARSWRRRATLPRQKTVPSSSPIWKPVPM